MNPPFVRERFILQMVVVGADSNHKLVGVPLRRVNPVVFLLRLQHRRHISFEEWPVQFSKIDSFRQIAHRVSRDIVRPSCFGGHFVNFERLIFSLENGNGHFVAGLGLCANCQSKNKNRFGFG